MLLFLMIGILLKKNFANFKASTIIPVRRPPSLDTGTCPGGWETLL